MPFVCSRRWPRDDARVKLRFAGNPKIAAQIDWRCSKNAVQEAI